jgi:hypothetical protein
VAKYNIGAQIDQLNHNLNIALVVHDEIAQNAKERTLRSTQVLRTFLWAVAIHEDPAGQSLFTRHENK